jgi:SAM-dependent methyltransferase
MELHPIARAGFSSAPEAYERGRPEYPHVAMRWVAERLGLGPEVTVVDLAAGTGKLSRPLAATGATVLAVEPVEPMRAVIGTGIETVDGTAEAIPLPDESADAVTVGQAFHWFDGDRALAEIHRVLRPGGTLALAWNARRMEDPMQVALEAVIGPYCENVPRHRRGAWREAFARTQLFGPLEEVAFPHSQELDAEGLAARVGSISAIAALGVQERDRVLSRVRELAGEGKVLLRYTCEVQVARARRREARPSARLHPGRASAAPPPGRRLR